MTFTKSCFIKLIAELLMNIYFSAVETPIAPINIIVTGMTSTSVSLQWSPSFDGNSAIVQYVVQYAGGIDNTTWSAAEKTDSQQPSYVVTNLHPYANYTFRVAATNSIGTGDFSDSSSVALTSQDSKQEIHAIFNCLFVCAIA